MKKVFIAIIIIISAMCCFSCRNNKNSIVSDSNSNSNSNDIDIFMPSTENNTVISEKHITDISNKVDDSLLNENADVYENSNITDTSQSQLDPNSNKGNVKVYNKVGYNPNIYEASGMPVPFEYMGGDMNEGFAGIYGLKLYNTFDEAVKKYLGISDKEYENSISERFVWNYADIVGKTSLMDTVNTYSVMVTYNIPDAVILEEIEKYNQIYEGFAQEFCDDGYRNFKYNEKEIEALLSRDASKVLEAFATQYAILIDDNAYTPSWLYIHPVEDWRNAGITPQMLEEKCVLYEDFYFTEEAAAAFSEKLSEFLDKEVVLKQNRSLEENDNLGCFVTEEHQPIYMPNPPNIADENGRFLNLYVYEYSTRYYTIPNSFSLYANDQYDAWIYAASDTAYFVPPLIYCYVPNYNIKHFIEYFNIDKETLKSILGEEYAPVGNDDGHLNDTQIDALYSDDPEALFNAFPGKFSFFHNGKVYSPAWLLTYKTNDYAADGIPVEKIEETITKCEESGLFLQADLDIIKTELEKYKKLIGEKYAYEYSARYYTIPNSFGWYAGSQYDVWLDAASKTEYYIPLIDYNYAPDVNVMNFIKYYDLDKEKILYVFRKDYKPDGDGDKYINDTQIDALCSDDPEALFNAFPGEFAFFYNGKAYAPIWLMTHTAEDYATDEIPAEIIEETIAKCQECKMFAKAHLDIIRTELAEYKELLAEGEEQTGQGNS